MAKNKDGKSTGSNFYTVEAYKLARTNIALSVIKQGCKRVMFTSAVANEGKTTTTCNVAAAFSKQMNNRVLLMDCDLRKPSVAKFFRLKNTPGITNYLSGMCGLEDIIQVVPGTNLSVVCAGLIPPNPSELLESQSFSDMLDILSERFDYILIDTTPVNVVVDALPLAKKVDGVAVITFAERSNYVELDKAIESLKRFDAKIIGFIMNGGKIRQHRYRYQGSRRGYY
ncbi:MAG: CpsD/CapB family tyrosine-protein kinase [Clostridia bacterium]|nr:CpsD/CapB family tyrosine-protein kinase [Clostridia bacterium]